jgi:hypothetical protein
MNPKQELQQMSCDINEIVAEILYQGILSNSRQQDKELFVGNSCL